jgi:hypothetical protein
MRLDCPALLAREVLQTATCGIERLVNGHTGITVDRVDLRLFAGCVLFDVFQSAVQRWFVAHDNRYATRDRDLDPNVEVPSVVVMPVRNFDEDAAPDDARVELLQPADTLMNVGFERIGVSKPAERHLGWDQSHDNLSVVCPGSKHLADQTSGLNDVGACAEP